MNDPISLLINGKTYDGWKEASVVRSIKSISGSFALSVTDNWTDKSQPWIIVPGDKCELRIADDLVLTGYVDAVQSSMSGKARQISVSGRDKTGDLVDCSAVHNPSNWGGITLKALAEKICKPFGISVVSDVDVPAKFLRWCVSDGEKAFETLDRAARLRGVLLYSNGDGALVIARAGTKRSSSALVQGQNILDGRSSYDHRERFSSYTVKSQLGGLDEYPPDIGYHVSATVADSSVSRYRPLVIIAEAQAETVTAQTRAQWEANVRAGRSAKITVTVEGFRQSDGRLWAINETVAIKSPWLGVDANLLVTSVAFSRGEDKAGVTVLELEMPEAYSILPKPNKADLLTALARGGSG